MSGIHKDRIVEFERKISEVNRLLGPLPGINSMERKLCWARQIVSSLRRISYTDRLIHQKISPARCDPKSKIFDPIRGALYLHRTGNLDEAVWLTFILTHFGRHNIDGS